MHASQPKASAFCGNLRWRAQATRRSASRDSDSPTPDPACGPHPVCTGPSSEIRIGKQKERKEKRKRFEAKCFLSRATRLAQQKLFTICKFRMIFVALIPVTNYNAQIVVKKRIANVDLWLCTRQHERPRSQLAGSRVDGCRLCKSVQGKSLRCEDRSRRAGQAD